MILKFPVFVIPAVLQSKVLELGIVKVTGVAGDEVYANVEPEHTVVEKS